MSTKRRNLSHEEGLFLNDLKMKIRITKLVNALNSRPGVKKISYHRFTENLNVALEFGIATDTFLSHVSNGLKILGIGVSPLVAEFSTSLEKAGNEFEDDDVSPLLRAVLEKYTSTGITFAQLDRITNSYRRDAEQVGGNKALKIALIKIE